MSKSVLHVITVSVAMLLSIIHEAYAESAESRIRFIVEPGVHVGGPVEKQRFRESRIRYNADLGVAFDRADSPHAFGITLFSSFAGSDSRFAIRPRYTRTLTESRSFTLSAGYIFDTAEESNKPEDAEVSNSGFVGGGSLNLSDLALQLDVSVVSVGPSVDHEGGTETSLFGGVAFRGSPGLKVGAFAAGIVLVLSLIYVAANS